MAGFLLSICNNFNTFIFVLYLEKRGLDKLGLRAFHCRSGQVNKAQTFYDLFLMYTLCITLVFHMSLAVMLMLINSCFHLSLLSASLGVSDGQLNSPLRSRAMMKNDKLMMMMKETGFRYALKTMVSGVAFSCLTPPLPSPPHLPPADFRPSKLRLNPGTLRNPREVF